MGNVVSGLAEDSGGLTADLRAPRCRVCLRAVGCPLHWQAPQPGAGVRQTLLPAPQHGTRPETSVSWLSPPEPYSRQGISVPF